jgi:hypothetical protein
MQKELVMAKAKSKLVLIPMGKKLIDMTDAEIYEWAGKIWDELPKPPDSPTDSTHPSSA